MSQLRELLVQKRQALVKGWLDRTLATYSKDAAKFFADGKNRFTNPVGQRLAESIEGLLAELLDGADPQGLCEQLETIIELRAVQEFTPAQAVVFVFELKEVLREELGTALERPGLRTELIAFESRIDQLALYAFDIYTKSREKMHGIRIEEIKRRVAGLMRRSGMFIEDLDEEPDG